MLLAVQQPSQPRLCQPATIRLSSRHSWICYPSVLVRTSDRIHRQCGTTIPRQCHKRVAFTESHHTQPNCPPPGPPGYSQQYPYSNL
ncbi:hypothetical protein CDEST_10112 [Colletotrichum destructivum]|uniref:Uncharacterized protein n=1 Tax=Colletotrichum destructivum TaxID=34406 RepID=A0AAX4INI3_9PEZI|nr:hypothetical protein CDEST_10112 [Colletotrichum destructivum]